MVARFFHELTSPEIQGLDPARTILLLPWGAVEAHGPHLPLATDVIISEEMALRAAGKLDAQGLGALLLPSISYTAAAFADTFAGTVNIGRETLRNLLRDIVQSVRRSGLKHVCLVNSHLDPENIETLRSTASELDLIFPDKTRRRWVQTLTDEFKSGSCHAGQYETSLVLAVRPDLVKPNYVRLTALTVNLADKIREGHRSFEKVGMKDAYCGNPAAASKEEGERTFEALSDMIVTTVLEKLG